MLVELTEYLVKSLVKDPDSVSVKEIVDDEFVTIEVLVSNDEIGAVIGRNGTIANSIRTLVQAAAYNSEHKKVRINIDSF